MEAEGGWRAGATEGWVSHSSRISRKQLTGIFPWKNRMQRYKWVVAMKPYTVLCTTLIIFFLSLFPDFSPSSVQAVHRPSSFQVEHRPLGLFLIYTFSIKRTKYLNCLILVGNKYPLDAWRRISAADGRLYIMQGLLAWPAWPAWSL